MAHSKCSACQARVWREGDPAEHLGDLCPGCGGPLEPIGDLNALIGLHCLRARPRRSRGRSSDKFAQICAQIQEAGRAQRREPPPADARVHEGVPGRGARRFEVVIDLAHAPARNSPDL